LKIYRNIDSLDILRIVSNHKMSPYIYIYIYIYVYVPQIYVSTKIQVFLKRFPQTTDIGIQEFRFYLMKTVMCKSAVHLFTELEFYLL
jgi:hypothetical protein